MIPQYPFVVWLSFYCCQIPLSSPLERETYVCAFPKKTSAHVLDNVWLPDNRLWLDSLTGIVGIRIFKWHFSEGLFKIVNWRVFSNYCIKAALFLCQLLSFSMSFQVEIRCTLSVFLVGYRAFLESLCPAIFLLKDKCSDIFRCRLLFCQEFYLMYMQLWWDKLNLDNLISLPVHDQRNL